MAFRRLRVGALAHLSRIELIYKSNAIEGCKLTLKETYLVINDGLTVKGKSLKDHLEAKNHDEAVHFLRDLVEHQKRQSISEQLIRSLQQLIPLSALSKQSKFSEKYLNLLARSGKLDAHKEGRNWLSSQAALENYLMSRERKRK